MLAAINQYYSHKQAAALRAAQLRLSILQGLSNYRVEMLDNYWTLIMHSDVTNSYVSFEAARKSSPGAFVAIAQWESHVSELLRDKLKESKAAFDRLQKISREVLLQAATYPGMVPAPLVQWAQVTLDLQFTDVPRVANAYRITPDSQRYTSLLGQAVGSVTGEVADTAEKVSR